MTILDFNGGKDNFSWMTNESFLRHCEDLGLIFSPLALVIFVTLTMETSSSTREALHHVCNELSWVLLILKSAMVSLSSVSTSASVLRMATSIVVSVKVRIFFKICIHVRHCLVYNRNHGFWHLVLVVDLQERMFMTSALLAH